MNKVSKKKGLILVIILSLSIPLFSSVYPRLKATAKAGNAYRPECSQDYTHIEQVFNDGEYKLTAVHRGLPHNYWHSDAYRRKVWTSSFFGVENNYFEGDSYEGVHDVAQDLTEILTNKDLYLPYQGLKSCGGYHSDYLFKLSSGDKELQLMICCGCEEMIVKCDGVETTIYDVDSSMINRVSSILENGASPSVSMR